ncbi:MAG: c-type cytochrome [Myxococcota bacterium]|nr:c-type cytochrome [Myxococcota bacterium]
MMNTLLRTTFSIALCACAPLDDPQASTPLDDPQASTPETDEPIEQLAPAPWPPLRDPVTHDVDFDLSRVLERSQLESACQRYRSGDRSETTVRQCGKWMFFYESFGTVGIPTHLLEFLQRWFQPYYGVGFAGLGFVPSPGSEPPMPIGLVESTQRMGSIKTHAFTCASCHFGQMPDGRYAVGYPNLELDYGRFFGTMIALIKLSMNPNDPAVPELIRLELAEDVAQARSLDGFMIALGSLGLNMATRAGDAMSSGVMDLSPQEQLRFWSLRTGTMDFLTKPMADDGVWTVSRILNLWNLPTPAQLEQAEMPHGQLSWTGIGRSVMGFLHGFVAISGSNRTWTDEQLMPLEQYLYSLRAPAPLVPIDRAQAARGETLFRETGCLGCHDGPSGEGRRLFDFEEIGTDSALRAIYNPDPQGNLCCGLDAAGDQATRAIKSPRLAGQRYRTRLLHNGSLDNLRQLLCLEERPERRGAGQSSTGHRFGCDDLSEDQKDDLIAYLESL